MNSRRGVFISLEGPDGAGKTTQARMLAEKARESGIPVISTREPGGTPVGDAVRAVLLDPVFEEMTVLTEVFLYAAARAQLYSEVIKPALEKGMLVLCDRYIDSSLAYQAYGGGVDEQFVLEVNLSATERQLPDRTFILDLEPEVGFARRAAGTDRIEKKPLQYHRQVREGFLSAARRFPDRVTIVDASLSAEDVFSCIWREVSPLLLKSD